VKARLSVVCALALLASGCSSSSAAPDEPGGPTCKAGQYIVGDACAPLVIGGPPRSDTMNDAAANDASDGAPPSDGGSEANASDAGEDAGNAAADAEAGESGLDAADGGGD